MVKYVLKRIALMFFVFFTILTVCFVLVKLLPLVDAKQFGKDMNLIQQRREALGYNKPILIQYLIFLKRSVLGGDWGISEALYRSQDVWKVFTSKLPATMMVNIYSMIFAIPSGLLLGIFAALKKNKWQDYLISTLVMVFISVPSYVYALLIQYLLCYKLKLFPTADEQWNELFFTVYVPLSHAGCAGTGIWKYCQSGQICACRAF